MHAALKPRLMIPSLRQHEPSQKNRFDPAQSINHLIVMRPSSTLFFTLSRAPGDYPTQRAPLRYKRRGAYRMGGVFSF
ncbi:MAG TPA: hypothetical protein DEG78_06430 [Rhodobacteraceae bacterium]|nr:hypothetical protein [Paracoccaceae bacterium]HCC97411.1 hypothetical protein [Paracoccaceae bacterium]